MAKIYLFSKTLSSSEGVTHIPLLQTIYLQIPSNIYEYDFLVITSKEAINALLKSGVDFQKLQLICISKKTAEYAQKHTFNVENYAEGYATKLKELLLTRYAGKKLLYLRAEVVASDELLYLDNAIVYKTVCKSEDYSCEANAILIFTSPSSIECFLQHNSLQKEQKIVCIGTTTQARLRGKRESYLADAPSIESCVQKAKELVVV